MSDADLENTETQIWLDFALACDYLKKEMHDSLYLETKEIGRLLNDMLKYPEKYGCIGSP